MVMTGSPSLNDSISFLDLDGAPSLPTFGAVADLPFICFLASRLAKAIVKDGN